MSLNKSSQAYDWTFPRVMWATLVFISVILSFWLLYRFNQVIFILFIAIVIGTVIRPVLPGCISVDSLAQWASCLFTCYCSSCLSASYIMSAIDGPNFGRLTAGIPAVRRPDRSLPAPASGRQAREIHLPLPYK